MPESQHTAKDKQRQRNNKWRAANAERKRLYMKAWREKNKEHVDAYAKSYQLPAESQAINRATQKRYYEEVVKTNPAKVSQRKQYQKKWASANPEKLKAKSDRYRARNRELLAERQKAAYQAKSAEDRKALVASRADYQRRYREEHNEELRESAKRYHEENKDKHAEQARQYYLANREHFIEEQKRRYASNPQPTLDRSAKWAREHPERVKALANKSSKKRYREDPEPFRARHREWRLRHIEERRAYTKKWVADNQEKIWKYNLDHAAEIKERGRRWKQEHPEHSRAIARARRARARGAEGAHTDNDIAILYDSQIGTCASCSKELNGKYEVDHVMPFHLGGSNWPENLQLLCRTCNRRKGHKHPDVWAARLAKQRA